MRYMRIRENDGPSEDWEVLGFPETMSADKAAHEWMRRTYHSSIMGYPRPGGFAFQMLGAGNMVDALIESVGVRKAHTVPVSTV